MQILEYHVYSQDAYKVSDFKKHSSLVTAEGETLTVSSLAVLHLLCVAKQNCQTTAILLVT
jgi:hypothetical protein